MLQIVPARRFLWAETHSEYVIVGVIVALAFFAYAIRFQVPPFFGGDAEHYWKLGTTFFSTGSFSLVASEQTFRGYLLPLIFGVFQHLGDATRTNSFSIFYAVNALFTACSLAVIIPLLVGRLFDVRVKVWQVFLFCFFFFAFWRGYLVEPLSDTWSLFLILMAILALLRAKELPLVGAIGFALLSGLCLGAAINIRPNYLICLPLYAAGLIFATSAGRASTFTLLAAAAAGLVLILLPQAVINHRFLGTWNPFLHSGNLYVYQLYFGLGIQRHECAYFIDPAGTEILKHAGIETLAKQPDGNFLFNLDTTQRSIADYISIVLGRPIDVILVYIRHVVNGISLLGSNIYACTPGQPKYLFNLTSMAVVVLATMAAWLNSPRLSQRRHHLLAWIPLIPVVLVVPVGMEGRFFFPVHLWAYAYLSFFLLQPGLRTAFAIHWRIVMPAFAAIFLLAAVQTSHMVASTYIWLGASSAGILLRPATILLQQ